MKLPTLLLFYSAALAAGAADPQPFAPAPFRLETPPVPSVPQDDRDAILTYLEPARPLDPVHVEYGIRLDFPIGPVRIDYGTPSHCFNFNGDFPGPGYRKLRDKKRNEGRNS
jgi:hypothetical protein